MRSGRNDSGNPPGTPASAQLRPSPPPPICYLRAMGLGTPCTHILILDFTCYIRMKCESVKLSHLAPGMEEWVSEAPIPHPGKYVFV